ncbi:MAG: hypothetical protein ACMXYA_02790 [Candidatus Woesearchaeota archaeon]
MIGTLTPNAEKAQKLKDFGFTDPEKLEARKFVSFLSGYPTPLRRYRIDFESENHNVEEVYFWLLSHARDDFDMPIVQKIIDTHASSTASSMFGDLQGRLGAQQSAVSNYLGMMGKLVKDLFSLVRELRQLDERLGYYTQSYGDDKKTARQAESTLKDIWITLVEGGTNSPSSVYGMAKNIGFTVLPDLFFAAKPMSKEELDDWVEALDFNEGVKKAVGRKLFQFMNWKEKTYHELTHKRQFQIKYLNQHFQTVRMYMEWIKPYLRNIQRLTMDDKGMEDGMLVHSFDMNMSEIEVLVAKPPAKEMKNPEDTVYSVLLMTFSFRTKPKMDFHAKDAYHQKGPVHIGRTESTIRAYAWTAKEIQNYKAYREKEAFDLVAQYDKSLKDAMEYLGEDLENYLKEAHADIPDGMFAQAKKKESKEDTQKKTQKNVTQAQQQDLHAMFLGPFKAMSEMLVEPFFGPLFQKSKTPKSVIKAEQARKNAIKEAKQQMAKGACLVSFQCFKNYKKAHGMISW